MEIRNDGKRVDLDIGEAGLGLEEGVKAREQLG